MGNVLVFAEHLHGKFSKSALVAVRAGQVAGGAEGGRRRAAPRCSAAGSTRSRPSSPRTA